jgi:TRAP-type transport system periplasmic protein
MEEDEMRTRFWFALSICAAAILAFSGGLQAQTYTLTYADQNPELGWGPTAAFKPWKERIEKASGGRIQIRPFYAQTLAKGPDIWNAVKSGIADIGWCFHGYWPGMTPLADVISLPSLPFKTAEEGSETLWKLYEKFPSIRKQFEANHVLLLYTSDPYFLITTKKPVRTLEDIVGMKIRMAGGPSTEMMKALGGVPVAVPMPDNYISLQKGVIDGMGAPWEATLSFRLYEVVNHYTTNVSFPAVYFSISMNKNKWNSLPKDLQQIIMQESGLKGSMFWGANFFDRARGAMMEEAAKKGIKVNIYDLPESERLRWQEVAGKPVWNDWLRKMNAEGHTDAKDVLDTLLGMY